MKKLMIAAAAAAMIGGVEATEAEYRFEAYLTTTGPAAYDVAATEEFGSGSIDLGLDEDGNIWYESAYLDTFTTSTVRDGQIVARSWRAAYRQTLGNQLRWVQGSSSRGVTIPKLEVIPSTRGGVQDNYLDQTAIDFLDGLRAYNLPSGWEWCCQLTWATYDSTPAVSRCFRVDGYVTISTTVKLDELCCSNAKAFTANGNKVIDFGFVGALEYAKIWSAGAYFTSTNNPYVTQNTRYQQDRVQAWDEGNTRYVPNDNVRMRINTDLYRAVTTEATEWGILNRYGAPLADDAEQIEIFAKVGNVKVNAYDDMGTSYTYDFNGYLAGHGYKGDAYVVNGDQWITLSDMPTTIDGGIVGYTEAPKCWDCCVGVAKRPAAIAFDCLNTDTATTPRTAAWGQFYIWNQY